MPLSSPLRLPLRLGLAALAARRGGVPDPAPPVNVSLPSIIGTPAVGSEVTANQGGWSGYPSISYAYQWRRDGVNISGATSQAYTIQAADYEASLTVVVSATNTEGGPVNATSPDVTVIGVAPVNTVDPAVSGSSGFGDVLTTTDGTWTGYPASFTYAYQWQRNGSNIGGATASTYTIVAGDSAASITCVVTATNAEGSAAQASNGVTAQTFTAPVISGLPTISGTAEVGQLLTASAASVTGNPSPSRTWQWLRDGSSISGATSATYTLVSADGGTDVSVRQTETNALGTGDSVSAVVEVPVSGFDPATLFASAEPGGWYDPSDFSTMFQDTAGTVPVTAVGQAVARINDKSGRGNHATQANLASRPLLEQDAGGLYYLRFDGVDDGMSTASINFTATDKVTLFLGLRKLSDAAAAFILELSANTNSNSGCFNATAPAGASPTYGFTSKGTAPATANYNNAIVAAPVTSVLTAIGDISGLQSSLRLNGAQVAINNASQGSGNYGNYALFIGSRGGSSSRLNGRIYSIIIRGAATTAGVVTDAEAWVNGKTGAF